MAWSGYLPAPCNAASRRLPCAGGGLRSGPARLRPSTCALSVHAISRAAQASPLAPLTVSHFCASHNLGTGWILSPPSALSSAKHGGEAATRGGASADGGTRQTPRCGCAARREVFRPSASRRSRGWMARLTPDARALAGGAPPERHQSSALTECAGREMPPPPAEPALREGLHGDGRDPERNPPIAERGADAARRPFATAGEVA